jgi:predicted HTH transcriptional regulator
MVLIVADAKITFAQLSQKTALSRRTISRVVKSLQNKGKLKRIGSARAGYWEVVK